MTQHRKIMNFLTILRESHPVMDRVFMEGSCFNLFCLLRSIWSEAEAWGTQDHVITKIDGRFYDIRGTMSPLHVHLLGYKKLTAKDAKDMKIMYKYVNKNICIGKPAF